MDAGLLLAGAGVSGALAAGVGGESAARWVHAVRMNAHAQSLETFKGGTSMAVWRNEARLMARYLLRNGLPSFNRPARVLLQVPAFDNVVETACGMLGRKGVDSTGESLVEIAIGIDLVVFALILLLSRSLLVAASFAVLAIGLAVALVSRARDNEQNRLRELVPDALRCMEACFHAGLSLPQAFAETAKETPAPLRQAFARVSHDLDLGYSVDDALDRFRRLSGLPELSFVAVALDVQYICGGDASSVLRIAQDSVEHSLALRRSLRVQTAQAKLSAQIVSLMPVLLVGVLSLLSPGFLSPFFESSLGAAILAGAVCMQIAGILIVRRMLDVDMG